MVKIRLKNPARNKILIFDKNGEVLLSETVLQGLSYSVLPVRREFYYLSLPIIVTCLKHIIIGIKSLSKGEDKIRKIIREAYCLSCIEYINPKVVIAFIDNSQLLFRMSELYPKARFIAIQNGTRTEREIVENRMSENDNLLYLCFGLREKHFNKKYGHKTKNIVPVGSLRGGYYKYVLSENEDVKFDICLVSQFREKIIFENQFPMIKENLRLLNIFLSKFSHENELKKICVACNSEKEIEADYYKIYFKNATIVKNNKKRRKSKTYRMMNLSEVVVAFDSTAAFEAYGWGKKVLFCNLTGWKEGSYSIPDMCYIDKNSYEVFEKKLTNLLAMDYNEYQMKNKKYFKYFMNYNPQNPPHKYIRDLVLGIIGNR